VPFVALAGAVCIEGDPDSKFGGVAVVRQPTPNTVFPPVIGESRIALHFWVRPGSGRDLPVRFVLSESPNVTEQTMAWGQAEKHAAVRLGHSDEVFRLLVEGVTDYAIFLLDPDGSVATWNAGAERIKGYKANEIIGQHFSCFYPKEARESRWPDRELAIATTEGRFVDEGLRLRKDGSTFWAHG